jgi:hypothetical protein
MASQNENRDPAFKNIPLTPEIREWALRQHTDDEVIAGLREAKEQGGPELCELIHDRTNQMRQRLRQ